MPGRTGLNSFDVDLLIMKQNQLLEIALEVLIATLMVGSSSREPEIGYQVAFLSPWRKIFVSVKWKTHVVRYSFSSLKQFLKSCV